MTEPLLAVIGGSGLYDLPGLTDTRWVAVDTPWGAPSDEIFLGRLGHARLAFLPRHGRGHRIPPSEVNYRANIAALKSLGATDVLSLSAVGGLRADLPPGTFVVVDQFIDRTFARDKSFFGTGMVAHVSMAHPVCPRLGDHVQAALAGQGVPHVRGGTYVVMEGPQFSTLAESQLYRGWNASVIGMTNMPEASSRTTGSSGPAGRANRLHRRATTCGAQASWWVTRRTTSSRSSGPVSPRRVLVPASWRSATDRVDPSRRSIRKPVSARAAAFTSASV